MSGARAPALSSRNSDDDAFGRSTHETSKGAQIKAGLVLLKKREDHGASQSGQNGRSSVALPWKNEGTERLSIIRLP
jgi:hypothetical protein